MYATMHILYINNDIRITIIILQVSIRILLAMEKVPNFPF